MILVAIVNGKGGVGKSTLTAALSVRASQESSRVALVDLDPQGSLRDWYKIRGKPDNPTILLGARTPTEAAESLAQTGWDWVFFDGAPQGIDSADELINLADIIIVPEKPSMMDLKATHEIIELAKDAGANYKIVLSDIVQTDRRLAHQARLLFENSHIPIATQQIAHRLSHVTAMNVGRTVQEITTKRDRDETACEEIEALWLEVKAMITVSNRKKASAA